MNEESSKYFSNSKEELEFYRNTYKLKVEELLSCQTKIKALENINNKLKEKMSKKSGDNESSQFILTNNEFKNLWESVIQTELIDSFDFCIKEYELISNLCQDIMLLVYEETKKLIELKFFEILKCLNLSKTSKIKKDNLYEKILPFFRENFSNIFEFNEDKIKNIKQKLKNIINQYNFLEGIKLFNNSNSSKAINENVNIINNSNDNSNINNNQNNHNNIENIKILENKIKGRNFDGIMKSFFNICLYMQLHEPILNFNIDEYSRRRLCYCFFNKKEYINVEGFGNERTPCIIILPPPLIKNKYPFNGLKPAVYIISDNIINKEIIQQCEINEKIREEEFKICQLNSDNIEENPNIGYNSTNSNNDNRKKIKHKIYKNNLTKKFNEENNLDMFQKANKNNSNNNIKEYDNKNLINKNNFIKNNCKKILNKSAKINNEKNILGTMEEMNNNYKMVNKNATNKSNKIENKGHNQQYNNIINKNNGLLDNINVNISQQNISSGYIQQKIINNQNIYKISYSKNNNRRDNYNNNIKNNNKLVNENTDTERKIRKEKTLPERLHHENELKIYEKNAFLNYSQKITGERNNLVYQENYTNKFEKVKKYIKNNNNNNKELKQRKSDNNINNNKNTNNINNYNNSLTKKNKPNFNNYMYEKNIPGNEKFKRNNTASIPSSEKINIKYYSSFNNILTNNNNLTKQLSNILDNNDYGNFNGNHNNILKKININIKKVNKENGNNIIEKKNNYYSYNDDYYYEGNNNNNEKIKFTERKIMNQKNNKFYNNIQFIPRKGIETSVQQNKYNGYNLKDNLSVIKKNNLFPVFNSINDNINEENINKILLTNSGTFQNQNINYINSINNINNFNNINNINNINYYNNIFNNSNEFSDPSYLKNNNNAINIEENNQNLNNIIRLRNSLMNKSNITEKVNKNTILNNYNNFNQSLNINNNKSLVNNFGKGYNMNNIILKNKNESNTQKERIIMRQPLSPTHLKEPNKLKSQNNQRGRIYKTNYLLNSQDKINKKQYNNKNIIKREKANVIQNNNNNNRNYNKNDIDKKNFGKNNKDTNYQMSKDIYSQQDNISKTKNIKKRNKSSNINHMNYNNIKKFYSNKNNINKDNNNNDLENPYQNELNIYYNNKNGNKDINNKIQNMANNNNDNYNLTNNYLSELEILKLNEKYNFNDSYSKEYGNI